MERKREWLGRKAAIDEVTWQGGLRGGDSNSNTRKEGENDNLIRNETAKADCEDNGDGGDSSDK